MTHDVTFEVAARCMVQEAAALVRVTTCSCAKMHEEVDQTPRCRSWFALTLISGVLAAQPVRTSIIFFLQQNVRSHVERGLAQTCSLDGA